MTDRAELTQLQDKARRAGRVALFRIDAQGWIASVFYRDPHGPGLQRTGLFLSPLAFAERERVKLAWWEVSPAPAR